MGYAILHMQKFTGGALRGIQSHMRREKPPASNPDIDPARSGLNYDLMSADSLNKRVNDRIHELELPKAIRKDAIRCVGFVISASPDDMAKFSVADRKAYFEDSLKWLENRYGKNNIMYACAHLDEKTQHLHVGIVPITKDGRLSAKSIFTRLELRKMQTDFARDIGYKYGLERGLEDSRNNYVKMNQLKNETAKAGLENLQSGKNESHEYNNEIDKIKENIEIVKSMFSEKHVKMSVDGARRFIQIARKGAKALATENALRAENERISNENRILKTERDEIRAQNQDLREKIKKLEPYAKIPAYAAKRIHETIKQESDLYRAYAADINRTCVRTYIANDRVISRAVKAMKPYLEFLGLRTDQAQTKHIKDCVAVAIRQARGELPKLKDALWGIPSATETDYHGDNATNLPNVVGDEKSVANKDWNLMDIFEKDKEKDKAIMREL